MAGHKSAGDVALVQVFLWSLDSNMEKALRQSWAKPNDYRGMRLRNSEFLCCRVFSQLVTGERPLVLLDTNVHTSTPVLKYRCIHDISARLHFCVQLGLTHRDRCQTALSRRLFQLEGSCQIYMYCRSKRYLKYSNSWIFKRKKEIQLQTSEILKNILKLNEFGPQSWARPLL